MVLASETVRKYLSDYEQWKGKVEGNRMEVYRRSHISKTERETNINLTNVQKERQAKRMK